MTFIIFSSECADVTAARRVTQLEDNAFFAHHELHLKDGRVCTLLSDWSMFSELVCTCKLEIVSYDRSGYHLLVLRLVSAR